MPLPEPVPGLVIRYSYLWAEEHERGQEEGVKDRPCAIVLMTMDKEGEKLVTVLPVTHTRPSDPALAVELPPPTKRPVSGSTSRAPGWCLPRPTASVDRVLICGRPYLATARQWPTARCLTRSLRRFG
ncbi:MAG TPA: hypothetical protein VGG61_14635 [Gemmataceae bacterium]